MKRGCKEIQITEEKNETIIGRSKEKLINNFKKKWLCNQQEVIKEG